MILLMPDDWVVLARIRFPRVALGGPMVLKSLPGPPQSAFLELLWAAEH